LVYLTLHEMFSLFREMILKIGGVAAKFELAPLLFFSNSVGQVKAHAHALSA
jgi:hypothetical protein